jgi:hypothetical protein
MKYKTSEKVIVNSIIRFLRLNGIVCERHNSGRLKLGELHGKQETRAVFLGTAGWPDIIGCLPDGRFLGIEVKTPERRNNLTALQFDTMAVMMKQGALAFTATGIDEVEVRLKREGYLK